MEHNPNIVFVFRFCTIPLFVKNYIGGLVNFSLKLYLLSACIHGLYVSTLLTWIGSVTHAVSKTMVVDGEELNFSGQNHWLFPVVGLCATTVFLSLMYYLYNKEFNLIMDALRE